MNIIFENRDDNFVIKETTRSTEVSRWRRDTYMVFSKTSTVCEFRVAIKIIKCPRHKTLGKSTPADTYLADKFQFLVAIFVI